MSIKAKLDRLEKLIGETADDHSRNFNGFVFGNEGELAGQGYKKIGVMANADIWQRGNEIKYRPFTRGV